MGACPGSEESAGVNYSHGCPKTNRQMRRVLNQAANAAVKAKGAIFAIVYRRLVPRLGHAQAIGAIARRLCRLIWKILHEGIRYEERGPAVSEEGGPHAQDDPGIEKSRLPRRTLRLAKTAPLTR
jgi:transposase